VLNVITIASSRDRRLIAGRSGVVDDIVGQLRLIQQVR
jgi:hypothetical protein